MLQRLVKTILFSLCMLASSMHMQAADSVSDDAANRAWDCSSDSDISACNHLKLKSLLAKKIKAACLSSKSIIAKNICTDSISTQTLCAGLVSSSESFCAPSIKAAQLCASNLRTSTLCAGTIYANKIEQCGAYKATVVRDVAYTYTLGADVNLNLILDDPNGNVLVNPTRYIVPVSGYYIATVQLDTRDLLPFNGLPILGTPVGNLHIMVNGNVWRESYFPYLTFFNNQSATITALICLNKGDIVSIKYDVLALDSSSGVINIAGTTVVEGNGSEANKSLFKIHYLSSDCPPSLCESACDTVCTSVACQPCTPVTTPCEQSCQCPISND